MQSAQELWNEYLKDRNKKAKSLLILQYVPLIKYVVGRFSVSKTSVISKEDMINTGVVALVSAIEKFEPTRGVKFETYAITRIKGSIIDELRRLDWVPRSKRRMFKKIQDAYEQLEPQLGRPAADEEIANHLGISLNEFNKALEHSDNFVLLSLEYVTTTVDGNEKLKLSDICAADENEEPQNVIEKKILVKLLTDTIKRLPEQERMVLSLYYYDGLTLSEISDILDLSISRISQVHSKAILRLRSKIVSSMGENIIEKKDVVTG